MQARRNQKCRRRPHRDVGIFTKNGTIRVVELHPTKGFREQNGEQWRGDFKNASETGTSIKLSRGNTRQIVVTPVQNNAPKIRHNKIG